MMQTLDQTFLIKLALSFLVGSIWITGITVIAERFGSKIGGFIGGFPSTVVIALLFIGLTQSPVEASRAATMILLVMGVNGSFILVYLSLVRRGLIKALLSALALWFLIIAPLAIWKVEYFGLSILVWLVALGFCVFVTERVMTIGHKLGFRVPYTSGQILTRGLVSGFMISLAVLIARLAGPTVGGIFSNFPVIFMSTLYITHRTGGVEFSRAVAKTLMLSAMINVGVYTISAHFAYLYFGLISGTLLALTASVFSAYGVYHLVRKRA